MNVNEEVANLFGEGVQKSYPTRADVAKLPTLASGEPDLTQLPLETAGNIIVGCLQNYTPRSDEEARWTLAMARKVVKASQGDGQLALTQEDVDGICKALGQEAKTEKKPDGRYAAWGIEAVKEMVRAEPPKPEKE